MDLVEGLTWASIAIIPAFLALDLVYRAKTYRRPRFFRLRAFAVTVGIFFFSYGIGLVWGEVLTFPSLFDLSAWNALAAAGVGVLIYQLALYWYHRAAHRFDWLWRAAHQMHHSTESHDAFGAYYSHPLDTFNFLTLSILVAFPLLGMSPLAGAIYTLFLGFNTMFQHANIRTPRWLGYFIQRPESHSLHHGRGVHRYNYADLPVIDMLFGSFRNPKDFMAEVGFHDNASSRVGAMIVGRDVSVAETDPGPRHRSQPVSVIAMNRDAA